MSKATWVHYLSGVAITASILTVIVMVFFVASPTLFQYRIAIALVAFALSSIAALLFTARVNIQGNIGMLTITVGGTAALWLGAIVILSVIFPEDGFRANTSYQLSLNLIFPEAEAPDPLNDTVKVQAFLQAQSGEPQLIPAKLERGPGGLIMHLQNLKIGDQLFLTMEDGTREWRSFDVVTPRSSVEMKPVGASSQ
jgi:hypothetical protein